jgi:hypothetical protein
MNDFGIAGMGEVSEGRRAKFQTIGALKHRKAGSTAANVGRELTVASINPSWEGDVWRSRPGRAGW